MGWLVRYGTNLATHHPHNRFYYLFLPLGLSDFSETHVVVVVGGCEGSSVLGVVDVQARIKTNIFYPFILSQKRKFHKSIKLCENKANARKFCLENFVDVIFLERTDYLGEKFFSLF